ncbi:MAG: hypothetical protein PHX43_08400 [Alphaproteobacteria bacterium]|nr:hypothetical protein [Alphaproteobacteria bacterium]
MMLSQNAASVLVDLVENKLAVIQVGGREDLREMITLQRCLAELKGIDSASPGVLKGFTENDIPRRGRNRKWTSMAEERE